MSEPKGHRIMTIVVELDDRRLTDDEWDIAYDLVADHGENILDMVRDMLRFRGFPEAIQNALHVREIDG